MRTRFDKSKIMKLAHHMVKSEGLTMSQALTLAWSKARRSEYYLIVEKVACKEGSIMFDMNMLANSLNDYYANYRYNGD